MQSKEQMIVFDVDHHHQPAKEKEQQATTNGDPRNNTYSEYHDDPESPAPQVVHDSVTKGQQPVNAEEEDYYSHQENNNNKSIHDSAPASADDVGNQQQTIMMMLEIEEEEDSSSSSYGSHPDDDNNDDDEEYSSEDSSSHHQRRRTGTTTSSSTTSTTTTKPASTRFFLESAKTFQTNWRTKLSAVAAQGATTVSTSSSALKLQQVWKNTTTTSSTNTDSANNTTTTTTTTNITTTTTQQLRAKLSDSVQTFTGRYKTAVASSSSITAAMGNMVLTSTTATTPFKTSTFHSTTTTADTAVLGEMVPSTPTSTRMTQRFIPKPLPEPTVTILLGKGMLGVNLKPTFLPNNGVYVDYLVPYHPAETSGNVWIGDMILAVGENHSVRHGTVQTVPLAIAQATPRPVLIRLGRYGDPTATDVPIHHIDVWIALIYKKQPDYDDSHYYQKKDGDNDDGAPEETVVMDVATTTQTKNTSEDDESEQQTSKPLAKLPADEEVWPVIESIIDPENLLVLRPAPSVPRLYIHQRIVQKNIALDDPEIHTALRNALWETIYDPRRRDFFIRFLDRCIKNHHEEEDDDDDDRNKKDVQKFLFLATDILEFVEFPHQPRKIYNTYLAPTALLDCHSICSDSELRDIERVLGEIEKDISESTTTTNGKQQQQSFNNMYNGYCIAALEQLEDVFLQFCQSPDCSRMRAYLRGTKPFQKIPLSDIMHTKDEPTTASSNTKFAFALVHAMTISAASDLCDCCTTTTNTKPDPNNNTSGKQYIVNKSFEMFRKSIYHEYMLQGGMSIAKLLRLAEFPPHVSVHKPMIDINHSNNTNQNQGAITPWSNKEALAQAMVLLRGTSAEEATREICEPLVSGVDLEVPLQVESYAWSSSPLSLVDFCVPRAETGDSLYGVSLSLLSIPSDSSNSSSETMLVVLVLLCTRNTIVPMREGLQKFYHMFGTFDVADLKGKLIEILTGIAGQYETKDGPENLFLNRSGNYLIQSLTPIPLALVFLTTLLEQKIVFISSRRSLLLAATTVIKELLQPLQWCHLFVPTVPLSLIQDLLQYPAPFLLGIESTGSTEVVRDLPHDVTLVDMDVGRVILGIADELRPSILAMAQTLGTNFGRAIDPETWRCDDILPLQQQQRQENDEPAILHRGFLALQAHCHEFCSSLVSNTASCCYKVDDTILFDESSFECALDDTLKDLFLRSQAMNLYIGTRSHEEMRC